MLGNSVGMGYYATDFEVIKTLYGPSRNFAAEYRTSDLPGGNPRMLRAFLKSKNPNSNLINLSGDGWDTNDHLGISLPSSSVPAHKSTALTLISLKPKPSLVFIPLQINDANHSVPVSVFASNTRRIVTIIKKFGMQPVIVKENDTAIRDYPRYQACISEIATDMKVEVIDTYTPTRNRPDLMRDYAHPNDAGHQVIFDQYKAWLTKKPGQPAVEQNSGVLVGPSACL